MTARQTRWMLTVLGVTAAWTGPWALLAPRQFYNSFPGAGRHWIVMDGAYNEHLIRDVGAMYLALLVLSAGAAIRADPGTTRLAGASWVAFGLPHLVYHSAHLSMYGSLDRALNLLALGASVALGALLCLPARGRAPGSRALHDSTGISVQATQQDERGGTE
ncbi:MAG TPA: hypothetical protein VLL08_01990 [Kineosporiaceae bacterium]|nr:hypothetical protein [Kineosporiaceae bacterium]